MNSEEDIETSKENSNKIQGLVGESSFSIILPKSIAVELDIKKGDFLKFSVDKMRLIIMKV